jgi:hypothetical protein
MRRGSCSVAQPRMVANVLGSTGGSHAHELFEMSMTLGHVWTAPWQEFLTFCSIGRVRSRVRPVCAAGMAAGPNALRGSGPKQNGALLGALTQAGSPNPRKMPSPIDVADLSAGVPYAASNSFGSLYLSPRTMMAQAIRAILLASATAATLVGRRSINRPSQGRFCVPCLRA